MIIEYKIDENDMLAYHLFVASKSERIKKKRLRNKVILAVVYVAIGLLFLYQHKVSVALIFIIVGLMWVFIYPIRERRLYVKHYKDFIKENFKDSPIRTGTLELDDDYILAKENGSESKILTVELEEICEIPTTIFVRLKGGKSFVLPKDKISEVDKVRARLEELAIHLKINYSLDENWKWR